jgi:nitrogen-specific signal transduction histidine kinase
MKFFPKEAWRYAILLIILFAIATVTVRQILGYFQARIASEHYQILAILISSLTLGFMLIAGAFGLWAIRFSAEAESRRRIGMFVDAMDYLSDGLLAVDPKGRITGSNPAARTLIGSELSHEESLRDAFPALSDADIGQLLGRNGPHEIERSFVRDNASRIFRLRSQPSEGLTFLLVSDITSNTAQLAHHRQLARLQLIGQIARGVAHDFNNLLCVISGHASLLSHLPAGSPDMRRSIEQIAQGSERGVVLANHLLDLAQPAVALQPTDVAHEYVDIAVQMLRDSLPDRWQIETSIQPMPTVALTGLQIEQVVLNLGYLCADALNEPGLLRITAGKPDTSHLLNVGNQFAGVLVLSAMRSPAAVPPGDAAASESLRESGVILSVLRSMIEEAGGTLDCMKSPDGSPVYRVALPYGNLPWRKEDSEQSLRDLAAYIARWSVLQAAAPSHYHSQIERRLRELSVNVTHADNVMSALALIEKLPQLDGIIVDKNLLKNESEGLLRAMVKLCPGAGIVALSDNPQTEPPALAADIIFLPSHADPNNIILSLVEAKNLAARRKHGKSQPLA